MLSTLTVTHVASHLLVLKNLAWILALASRTMSTVGDGNTMRCAHTTEAPTLHGAGKAFTLCVASNVDQLAINEMVSRNSCAYWQQAIGIINAEFSNARLWLDLCFGEFTTLRLIYIFRFTGSCTKADGKITITFLVASSDHLAAFQRQYGDRNVTAVFIEEAHHTHLFRDHASAHDPYSNLCQRPGWHDYQEGVTPKSSPEFLSIAPSGLGTSGSP